MLIAGLQIKKRASSLTEQVMTHLISQIENGTFSAGAKLPSEAEIVRQTGVSRTVVREALSKLQAAGFVVTRQGVGTFLRVAADAPSLALQQHSVTTVAEVLSVLELRIGIETEAAALAATRRTEQHLKDMRDALDAFRAEIPAGNGAIVPDLQFHIGIAQASGNPYFLDLLTTLGNKVLPRSTLKVDEELTDRQAYLLRINNEHEDIYHAIVRGDPEAARAAVRNHLGNSRERMRRAAETKDAK